VSHAVRAHVLARLDPAVVPAAAAARLALLVVGLLAARSAGLARIARELPQLALSLALAERIGRRRRRPRSDAHLDPRPCSPPVVAQVGEWPGRHAGGQAGG
jgi:hypothetical protein